MYFYLDRALRWKTEMLLESGFDLGIKGRTYRYLHHSQSQLKDKQFWFYHHNDETNFSFEDAFAWMGDFQEERIVAKHAARIAQCFTSAEATIQVKLTVSFYFILYHCYRFHQKKFNILRIFIQMIINIILLMGLEQCQLLYVIM
jgi:hypothetical protein